MQVKILGQILGIADDWDSLDEGYQVYNFKSCIDGLPSGSCVCFDLSEGMIDYYDVDQIYLQIPMLSVLKQPVT